MTSEAPSITAVTVAVGSSRVGPVIFQILLSQVALLFPLRQSLMPATAISPRPAPGQADRAAHADW
jgi:hypothetical protein